MCGCVCVENVEAVSRYVRRYYCSTLHHVTGQTVWAADWDEPGCKNMCPPYTVSVGRQSGLLTGLFQQSYSLANELFLPTYRRLSVSDDVLQSEGLWKSRMSMANDRFSVQYSTVHEMHVPLDTIAQHSDVLDFHKPSLRTSSDTDSLLR